MRYAWVTACIVVSLTVVRAPAHIVYGGPTLYQLVIDSDLVVRARILDRAPTGGGEEIRNRPFVAAEVLAVYKGSHGSAEIFFAQHGHGVPPYEPGDEALLFLRRIERVRELDQLATTGETAWVSLQEHDSAYTVTPAARATFDAAVRAYVAATAISEPSARLAALRAVTITQLRSTESRLANSSLRDLILMSAVLVTEDTAPALIEISDDPATAIGIRLGVLTVLEQQGMVDGPTRWAHLLQTTSAPDRLAVVRAAAAHPSPPVTAELVKLVGGDDAELAAAAAVSLGAPGNDAAIAPLVRAAGHGDDRLQMAAIRGLGGIATDSAKAALEKIAQNHPEPATRRRASGEVARLTKLLR